MKPINITTTVDPTNLFTVATLACNPLLIEEECVRVINDGKNKLVTTPGMLIKHREDPVVIVGLERYSSDTQALLDELRTHLNHRGPVTMHLYITPVDGVSFQEHTDPDDVVICLVEGEKVFEIDGVEFNMVLGSYYLIPANVKHRAISSGNQGSVMLSMGMETYLRDKMGVV